MKGVDEFNSVEHAAKCAAKAEKRIKKAMISIVISMLGIIGLYAFESDTMKGISYILVLASFCFAGTWFYMFQFVILGFRKLRGFIIIRFVLGFCWAQMIFCTSMLIFPPLSLLYEIYLCKKTIQNVRAII